MSRENYDEQNISNSYQLSPHQLEELYRKYGRPGELSPGQPAKRKRNRLDSTLASMDRRDNKIIHSDEDTNTENTEAGRYFT